MYVKTNPLTQEILSFPYTEQDLKNDNPSISFPRDISEDILNTYDVYPVVVQPIPVFDKTVNKLSRNSTPTFNGVDWELGYEIIPKTALEIQQEYESSIPKVVTMRQARLALLQSALLQTVTDAINNGTDEAMKIEWEYATEVDRNWPSLITLTTTLGMTSTDLDNLFILASTL